MDLFDDVFNDQLLQFSPLRLSPSPEPFSPLMEFLQDDPLVEETENVNEETVGLTNNPAITEANPSMGTQSPTLAPFPETFTLVQTPPEMDQQQLLCNSQGYFQENIPNSHADQQFLFNQNMDAFQQPDIFGMPHQPLCNSHGYLQGNLTNGQLDQQSFLNQNTMNPFPEPNDSTMIENGQQMEEENSAYANPIMTDQSFELPNHLQEQCLSLPLSQSYPSNPTSQHSLVASHFNMYEQQPPPLVLPNREDEVPISRIVPDVARTYPQHNHISVTPPLPPMPPPLPQMPSSSTGNQGNVQERVINQPSPGFRYPTLDTYARAEDLPCTKAFAPQHVLGRRQRNNQSRFERGESSSAAQRRRIVVPKRNADLGADNGQERLQNSLYSPLYETLGLKIDPHLRNFYVLHKRNRK